MDDVSIFHGHLVYVFGTFYGLLVHFVEMWCILPHFGMLYQEKSGNPAGNSCTSTWKLGHHHLPTHH
jgi:hypothetical protein